MPSTFEARALEPRLILPSILGWIRGEIAAFGGYKIAAKAEKIYRLLDDSFFARRSHTSPIRFALLEGISPEYQFDWAQTFTEIELKSGLGGNAGDYRKIISHFWHFPPGNVGYDKDSGATKPYVLRPEVEARLTDFWRGNAKAAVLDATTQVPLQGSAFPANGIIRTSFSTLRVPGLLEIDPDALDDRIAELENAGGLRGERLHISKRKRHVLTLRHAYAARKWIKTLGGIPNLYSDYRADEPPDSGMGRLYGIGSLHLQNAPRRVRSLVASGQGWYDFDFRACHASITVSLMDAYGCESTMWRDYLANRETIHEQLADEIDIPVGKAKKIINALIYGQKIGFDARFFSLAEELKFRESIELLAQSIYYHALQDELHNARSVILARHTVGHEIVNAVGKRLSTAAKPESQFSCVLTGYEAWALNLVNADRDDLKVIIHDGWIGEGPRNTDLISADIASESFKQFGFPIQLKVKCVPL